MPLSSDIAQWVKEEGSFAEGLALYRRVGGANPEALEAYLQLDYIPDPAWLKLNTILQTYLQKYPPDFIQISNVTSKSKANTQLEYSEQEPEAILKLRAKAKLLHKKQAALHTELGLVQSDQERYAIAEQLMEVVIPELDSIYATIRTWQDSGTLPNLAQTNDLVRDTVQKFQRTLSLTPRISKLKKWLNGGRVLSDLERQKYAKELLEKEVELKELKKELNI